METDAPWDPRLTTLLSQRQLPGFVAALILRLTVPRARLDYDLAVFPSHVSQAAQPC